MPLAVTLNVALFPAVTDMAAGCDVMLGAVLVGPTGADVIASVVTTPAGVTSRIAALPVSATKTFPLESTISPVILYSD